MRIDKRSWNNSWK